jgi:hypothetical protein
MKISRYPLQLRHGGKPMPLRVRFHPEDLAEFDRGVRAWGRGSNYVHLTPEQYSR